MGKWEATIRSAIACMPSGQLSGFTDGNTGQGSSAWAAGALAFRQAELTVQALSEMIKDLNDMNTRCSGLPLGGREGDQTANQVPPLLHHSTVVSSIPLLINFFEQL